jgi:hypothetical protein
VITVNYTYQKSLASESTLVICALSRSRLSYFSASRFDFRRCFFEGSSSTSINSTSCVANFVSHVPSDTVKHRPWSPSFSS